MMKPWLKISGVWVLLLLLVAELVVRVGWARNMSGRFDYGYHPTAGFEEHGDKLNLVRAGGRRFRPQQMTLKRAPDTARIFVIGDSVPRGGSLKGAYAWLLGEELRKRGFKAESYNLAMGGFGARRTQIVLQQALKYEPSIVVLHVNNSNEFEDEREWNRRNLFAGWHPRFWLMKSLLLRRLHEAKTEKLFWELVPLKVRQQEMVTDADAELETMLDANLIEQWQQRVQTTTRESVRLAREAGALVVLVSQAGWTRGTDLISDAEGVAELCESLAGEDVIHVSMKSALTGQGPPAELLSDGAHMRNPGHRHLAEEILRQIPDVWLKAAVTTSRSNR